MFTQKIKGMKSKKILVTGGAGFMGSHLVDGLIAMGHDVYSVDDLSGGYKDNINKNCHFYKLDLRSQTLVEKYIKQVKPTLVYHLAADATEGRSQFTPLSSTQRNYLAYLNVLIPSIKYGLEKIVFTSSMSVYGSQIPPFSETMDRKPDDIYGISKASSERATEILSQVYGFKYVIFRPHNVYGPRQNLADPYRNVIGIFINCLLKNKNFYIYGDGNQKRAFSYVDDVIPYILNAGFLKQAEGEIFNIGPTEAYTINELSTIILETFYNHKKIPSKMLPKYVSLRPVEVQNAWCTVDKAEQILNYKTTVQLPVGVKRMIEWAKQVGSKQFKYLDNLELIHAKTPKTWTKRLI